MHSRVTSLPRATGFKLLFLVCLGTTLLVADVAIAKIIPAGYSITRWQRQSNIGIPKESMPIRGDTFAAFKANFQATFEQHLFEPVCEGPFGNKAFETQVHVPNWLEHKTSTGSVTISHTDRNIFCASGGVIRSGQHTHRGTFKRYCPAGFAKTDVPDDTNLYCAGPGLTLTADDSAANIVIEATLDEVPAGEYVGQFEITDFRTVAGVAVSPDQWGSLQPACPLVTDSTGVAVCNISYTPDLPGTATIEGSADVDGTVYTDVITVEANQLPDLSIDMTTPLDEPLTVQPNQEIPVNVTLENNGNADHDAPVERLVFLSEDDKLDDNDRVIATLPQLTGLAAGNSIDTAAQVTIPDDMPSGSYRLIAAANPAQFLAHQDGETPEPLEENYDNNLATLDVEVELPKVEIEICVGNPISTNSGRKLETEVDYQGTGPFPLTFARYYSSSPGNPDGWNTSYSRHLFIQDDIDGTIDIILVFDNGLRYEFDDIDARGFSDPDVPGLIARTANGFAYLDEDGTLHEFDTAGRLTGLISQTGLTQSLAYQNDQLVSVTDHFGRELNFEYNDDDLLSALHTPDGATYRYEYNNDGLFSAVVLPDDTPNDDSDNPRRDYLYESPYLDHGLTGIVDANGNRFSTFEYDEKGRAILTSHSGGAGQNTISYGENETTVTNPLGKQTTYVFEDILGSNRLVRVDGHPTVNCPATTTTQTYDSRGSVTREVDAEGNVTEYTYTHTGLPDDEYLYHIGLVTSRTEAAGTVDARTVTTEWHPDFRLPVTITEPGRRIELTYDDDAQLVQREVVALDTGDLRVWQYSYNDQGLLIEVDGPRTDVDDTAQLQYNDQGEVTKVINALGHTTRIRSHDANGLPLEVQEPNGLIARLQYDAQRRLVAQTVESEAGDATTGIDYDPRGNVTAIQLPDGQTLHYAYDHADRLVQIENDRGETIDFTLDAEGNRMAEITRGAGGSIVRVQNRAFDELSRTIETVGAAGQTTQLGYDNNDNLTQVDDALGRRTDMAFDGLDRLISITDALNGESTFTYDARDNLTSVTDAEGVTTTYTYDGHNNLVEEDSTASGITRHTYDAAGNRIETVDANGVVTAYDYDALNRLTAIRYPSSPDESIDYTYDAGPNGIGRLTMIEDPSGQTTFVYDQRGNLITDRRNIDGVSYSTHYAYNLANQATTVTYPSGRRVHYELDSLSRVTAITTQANGAAPKRVVAEEFDYLPFGPATGWQHGNGLTTDIDYDQDYRITDIEVADMNEIMSLTYGYNDVSNITRILDNLGINDQDFQYDALNRLTFASGNYGEIDYTYDGVGNRLSRRIEDDSATTNETYQYEPGSHRLDRVTTTDDTGTDTRHFAHDNNGNIVSDGSGERELKMDVNAHNRLEAIRKDGERVGEYQYNALRQRVAKTSRYRGRLHSHFDQGNKGVIPTGGRKTTEVEGSRSGHDPSNTNLHSHYDNKPVTERLHFHYDQQGNLIAETDNKGNIVREYIYLGNYRIAMTARSLDKPGMSPGVISTGAAKGRGVEKSQGPLALYYIHNDHLGTPNKVTDTEQRIVWSMEQTPFGEVALTTEAIRMPMRFPGQYADIESGFSYNYFRDYDPSIGRYIQGDPIGLQAGFNTYAYALAAPKQFIDPDGRAIILGNIITGVVGGIINASLTAYGAYLADPEAFFDDPNKVVTDVAASFLVGAFTASGIAKVGAATSAAIGFITNLISQSINTFDSSSGETCVTINLGELGGATTGAFLAGRLPSTGTIEASVTAVLGGLISTTYTTIGTRIGD